MTRIQLKRTEWDFDPSRPIGKPGGFGAVYHGADHSGEPVAIKRLHLGANESAHRELRVADLIGSKTTAHVIPVLDSGEDKDSGSYFIVMPVASESLQDRIEKSRAFSQDEIRTVLLQICNGLRELAEVVHRDLKPGNILCHQGTWKVADFGIAKFVEESTSLQTLKDCLTAPYAAPEQWMYQRSTSATDLYALGCIAFQLMSGSLPFSGPRPEDFRDQHIMRQPPSLPVEVDPKMRTLAGMLLRKAPESRPSLKRVIELLSSIETKPLQTAHPLAQAAARLEIAQAKADSEAAELKAKADVRQRLAESARDSLCHLTGELHEAITSQAVTAHTDGFGHLRLGAASLMMPMKRDLTYVTAMQPGLLPHSGIDMVSIAQIILEQSAPPYKWSCSLLYAKLPASSEYRWYEVGFRSTMNYDDHVPFSLMQGRGGSFPYRDIDLALGNGMHSFSSAFGPVAIDDEKNQEFLERWVHLFALAAEGELKHPQGLPLNLDFWKAPHF